MRIGNCKLSYSITEKIMPKTIIVTDEKGEQLEKNNVTANEIDLLISLSLRQDPRGKVEGIHYKDMQLEIGFKSEQTFYNILRGLEEKGYIKINYYVNSCFWEITILENIFMNKEDDQKGYFNINRAFLYTPEFKKLKANEKKICIKLAITYQESNCEKYGLKIYPKTIANWIGIKTVSLVYRYLDNIAQFFPFSFTAGKEGTLIHFLPNNLKPFISTKNTEREHFLLHKIKHFCRVYKIAYTLKDLNDLIILMGQYASKGIGKLFGTICDVLIKKRSIEPKLINSILSGNYGRNGQAPLFDSINNLEVNYKASGQCFLEDRYPLDPVY